MILHRVKAIVIRIMKSAAEHGTQKLYLDDFTIVECNAVVEHVEDDERGTTLVLNQTCFYPGGGGQPCDLGVISWDGGSLKVKKVHKDTDGMVFHVGELTGNRPIIGEAVTCSLDIEKRRYHSRLHSAGHLLDLAVKRAGYTWEPGRGAHFPDMSFVEYSGEFNSEQADEYRLVIQTEIDAIIKQGGVVTTSRVSPDEARRRSAYIPEQILKKYEQIHLATYNGSFDICCGGTHVQDVADIGEISVTKIKKKDAAIRVSYSIEKG